MNYECACGVDLGDSEEDLLHCFTCDEAVCAMCLLFDDDGDICQRCFETRSEKVGKRGFGGMSLEKRRAIASLGGKTAQKKGVAHKFDAASAARAGKIGGAAVAKRGREYMGKIGKLGGEAKAAKRKGDES